MSDLAFLSLTELAHGLQHATFSSEELTRVYLGRIALGNTALGAYVRVDEDSALQLARAADARRASGYCLGRLTACPSRSRTCATSKARSRQQVPRTGWGVAARRPRRQCSDCCRRGW